MRMIWLFNFASAGAPQLARNRFEIFGVTSFRDKWRWHATQFRRETGFLVIANGKPKVLFCARVGHGGMRIDASFAEK